MEVLKVLDQIFQKHAPETLMAFFGAATSVLLFYLVWVILRHLFGLQTRRAGWEASQEQATAALVEALVSALVTEAGHLRETLDNLLEESLQRSERNAQLLAALLAQTEQTPGQVVALLKPEFVQLHQAMLQAEARMSAKGVSRVEENEAGGWQEPGHEPEGAVGRRD